jgi:hypothetical protein
VLIGDQLIYQLMRRTIASGVQVANSLDVSFVDAYPFVTFTSTGGLGITAGGAMRPAAWSWDLDVNLFHDDLDEALQIAAGIYEGIHTWNDPWPDPDTGITSGVIDGLGHATAVSDRSLFSRTTSAEVQGHMVHQLTASFSMQLHQA